MRASLVRPSRRAVVAGLGGLLLARGASAQSDGDRAADGFRVLRARLGTAQLRGDAEGETAIWGYDGLAPGPVLRARRGEEFRLRLVNELPEPTAVHWHGLRIANAMDGVPHLTQAPIEPGASFDYRFTPPDAGTFWYHAPLTSPGQIARGLAGALIVDDPTPVGVDRDLVLLVQDWRDAAAPDFVTINGKPKLDVTVRANERVRLRLINASNSRVMPLRLEGVTPTVVAIDGQPAEPFRPRRDRVMLAPGSRVDLFADVTLAAGASASLMLDGENGSTPLVRFTADAGAPARAEPRNEPPSLPAPMLPARMDFARSVRAELVLGGALKPAAGNGGKASAGPHGPALFSAKRGRTVMLALPNRTASPYVVHVHGHHFRLLDSLDDGWKPYWLDTLLVEPQRTARIAFVADNPGKWMIHCRTLEREQTGMTAWFEVT